MSFQSNSPKQAHIKNTVQADKKTLTHIYVAGRCTRLRGQVAQSFKKKLACGGETPHHPDAGQRLHFIIPLPQEIGICRLKFCNTGAVQTGSFECAMDQATKGLSRQGGGGVICHLLHSQPQDLGWGSKKIMFLISDPTICFLAELL